jgi:hypothetical protein
MDDWELHSPAPKRVLELTGTTPEDAILPFYEIRNDAF